MIQYDKHTVHCVLGSVSSNSHNSMFPTSWIICLILDKRLSDWFFRRSCRRACRSGWFTILWINCRTLVLWACFTTECGSPGIQKSMSASLNIINSWLSSWSAMDFFHSFTKLVIFNVERIAFMRRTCSRAVFRLNRIKSSNKSLRSFWRTEFFAKRINIDLLRTGTRFFHLACYKVAPIFHELDLELVGLVGQFLLDKQLPRLVVEQLPNPILFSIRASMRSLVVVEVTCILSHFRLLQSSV